MVGTKDRKVERVDGRDPMVRVAGEQVLQQLDDSLQRATLRGLFFEDFAVVLDFALDGFDERLLDVFHVERRGAS